MSKQIFPLSAIYINSSPPLFSLSSFHPAPFLYPFLLQHTLFPPLPIFYLYIPHHYSTFFKNTSNFCKNG